MRELFGYIKENNFYLNNSMPVVSDTELFISVEKGSIYNNTIDILNLEEEKIYGLVESSFGIINIKDRIIIGSNCKISYSINAISDIDLGIYEDMIIITYNGGEIQIPVQILVLEKIENKINTRFIPKIAKKDISIKFDSKSYRPDDIGKLIITNPYENSIKLTITSLDNSIVFKKYEIEVLDTKTVEFIFKISKTDKAKGKIPLNIHPKIEMLFNIEINNLSQKQNIQGVIYLTGFKNIPTKYNITTNKAYKKVEERLYKEFLLINMYEDKYRVSDEFISKLSSMINYDKTNINLRLIYCFLVLENNKKDLLIQEINNIDRYLLYYDNENLDIGELLFYFIKRYKGENIQGLINSWKPLDPNNWLKILIKNKLLNHNIAGYDEYKKLYSLGVKNRILFSEAVVMLNKNPKIPFDEDNFYRALLKWTLNKNLLGIRWQKKIETSFLILIQHNNIDEDIAQKLYKLDNNKNMLRILALAYIKSKRFDEKSHDIFEKALSSKCKIFALEEAYIYSAYYSNQLLKIEYIRVDCIEDKLEEEYKNFYLLNVLIQKNKNINLYNLLKDEIKELKDVYFKDHLFPDDIEGQITYINYLLERKQYKRIIKIYSIHKLKNSTKDLILEVLIDHANWNLKDLFEIYNTANIKNLKTHNLKELLFIKAILSRKYINEVLEQFVENRDFLNNNFYTELINDFIIYQILIEDFTPSISIIKYLEEILDKESSIGLKLALLKGYSKSTFRNKPIIKDLIKSLLDERIIFSWYNLLTENLYLGNAYRILQYFEYKSQPEKIVYFYYRIDDEKLYKKVQMKHIALGLYIVEVVMFYNELIQYYIEEEDADDNYEIKYSNFLIKRDIIEQEEGNELYDLINTIEICKEVNDEISLEKAIINYIDLNCMNNKYEGIYKEALSSKYKGKRNIYDSKINELVNMMKNDVRNEFYMR